jgi:hypothetical protein
MTGMAYFFRNVNNVDELNKKTFIAKAEKSKMQKFRIIEKVYMKEKEYMMFQKSFTNTHTFIKEITYKLTMNSNAEYLCALVVSKEFDYGILVSSSGYSYARTVAIIELGDGYGI